MKNSKEIRTCVGCRSKDNKYNLFRIIKTKENEIKVDANQRLMGRGTYICKNEECLKKAIKNKGLVRALKIQINDEKYNELRGVMFDK